MKIILLLAKIEEEEWRKIKKNYIEKWFYIKFLCNAGSIYSREVTFGETGDDDEDSVDNSDENEYSQDFDTEQLCRIIKISGLSSTMQIFTGEKLPLLFKSNVGNLGKIAKKC